MLVHLITPISGGPEDGAVSLLDLFVVDLFRSRPAPAQPSLRLDGELVRGRACMGPHPRFGLTFGGRAFNVEFI